MKVELKGSELLITIPVDKDPQPSASGKTLLVASTRGNQKTDVKYKGKTLVVAVNAYVKNGEEK